MLFQESTRTRRLVGRLEAGEDLVEALTDLCRKHDVKAGEVRAIGALSEVEVARFDTADHSYVTAFSGAGHFQLIHLTGNISTLGDQIVLRLESLLSVDAPAGPQLISGQLRRGLAGSCEFTLDIFDDLILERGLDADSGMLTLKTIKRIAPPTDEATPAAPASETPQPTPIPGKGMSWGDVVAESEAPAPSKSPAPSQAPRPSDQAASSTDIYGDVDLEGELMEAGDILIHPTLGRCRVMKVEDGEYAHVRLPRGKIRKLSLEIVHVELQNEEHGRRVFKAVIDR